MGFFGFRPKSLYRAITVAALFGVTALYLNGTRLPLPDNHLSVYLNDYGFRSTSSWQLGLFGGRAKWNSMVEYERLQGEYDTQRNYGLLDCYSEARYRREFSNLAGTALNDFIEFHSSNLKQNATNGVARAIHLDELNLNHASLVYAGVLAAVYTGRTLRYRVSSDVSVESQSLIRDAQRRQYFGCSSVSLGLSGGSAYDADAGMLNYSVRKSLTPHISMGYERSAEHSASVNFSAGF